MSTPKLADKRRQRFAPGLFIARDDKHSLPALHKSVDQRGRTSRPDPGLRFSKRKNERGTFEEENGLFRPVWYYVDKLKENQLNNQDQNLSYEERMSLPLEERIRRYQPSLLEYQKKVKDSLSKQPLMSSQELSDQIDKHYKPDVMMRDENGNAIFRVDKDGVPIYLKPPHLA